MPATFRSDFRRFFLRGLAAVLPTLLTLMIIIFVIKFVNEKIGLHINTGVIHVLDAVHGAPKLPSPPPEEFEARPGEKDYNFLAWQYWWNQRWYMQGVGFIVAIILVYFIGRFVASFVGRTLWRMIEQTLMRTPVLKQIYPSVKQVTDFFFSREREQFSRVVAVEYPRKGIWSVGLVTGRSMRTLTKALDSDLLTVFIPSSPTPVTGYTIIIRRDEVLDLPLTIDEALRFTVSGGVVTPAGEALPGDARRALAAPAPPQADSERPDKDD